ncbi:Bacterial toxin of type II toxin-antitoxin system, YafQ [Bifidobacterium samirii]|uniref:Bacterial toxin of type II toxin-antitoxin system, YafQ n=1 Tax=Bifidobacterium samirii TaxID=2306974 RepID=A0A430FTR1_9BIFI|nr:Bacterial toxin of type II toxin-antitoxin system, YafQ [Bifidobacterium samirii]
MRKRRRLVFEFAGTDWFYADLERLRRYRTYLFDSVVDLIDNHLAEYGGVPDECEPHRLSHGNGCLTGYMECHVEDDVLLVYRVVGMRILLVRICTHWELYTCRFDADAWPDPEREAMEKAAHDMTDSGIEAVLFD